MVQSGGQFDTDFSGTFAQGWSNNKNLEVIIFASDIEYIKLKLTWFSVMIATHGLSLHKINLEFIIRIIAKWKERHILIVFTTKFPYRQFHFEVRTCNYDAFILGNPYENPGLANAEAIIIRKKYLNSKLISND